LRFNPTSGLKMMPVSSAWMWSLFSSIARGTASSRSPLASAANVRVGWMLRARPAPSTTRFTARPRGTGSVQRP
jgi:hypothetical protein